jgi:hypothetical protein
VNEDAIIAHRDQLLDLHLVAVPSIRVVGQVGTDLLDAVTGLSLRKLPHRVVVGVGLKEVGSESSHVARGVAVLIDELPHNLQVLL